MAPPAKKQRRLVLSSDDEPSQAGDILAADRTAGFGGPSRNTRTRNSRSKAIENGKSKPSATAKRKGSLSSTPTSSPEKKRSRKDVEEAVKSKSLHSFFSKVTEEQRWKKKEPQEEDEQIEEQLEDIDDDSDDAIFNSLTRNENATLPLDRWKASARSNGTNFQEHRASSTNKIGPKPLTGVLSAQKFATGSTHEGISGKEVYFPGQEEDRRTWADRYAPQSLEELGIHKKKVADVKAWLADAFSHPHRRHLLVLKGPAGSGKTTAVSLLAKAMDLQLVEWKNSSTSEGGTSTSFVSHFDDFLGRGGHFGSLDVSGPPKVKQQSVNAETDQQGGRVLMVDEFPTTFTRSAIALHAFRSSLLAYLSTGTVTTGSLFQSAKSDPNGTPPIVMIVSETLLSSATASMDSLTAHRLLGPEISNHPCTHMIEFNPVAPTFISKALDIVVKKEARTSKRRRIPGSVIMKRLSEMGDIRSAVNSLEFLCLRGDETGDWGGRVAGKTKRNTKDSSSMTAREQESLELVTQRESTLGMFHAVGKVVYNKRDLPDTSITGPQPPPDHLQQLHRPKVSQVLVDDLMNETGTDISTFISSLHENYILSCNGSSFVDQLNDCVDYLSDSDLLDTDSRRSITSYRAGIGSARVNVQTGSTDLIRQSEISFDVAVRGLLFALPSPVSRATHPNGKKDDSHKMFFPAALRLWKKTEEIEGVVSVWRKRLESGTTLTAMDNSHPTETSSAGGVASWKRHNTLDHVQSNDPNDDPDGLPLRFIVSRNDLLLLHLPYLSQIHQPKDKHAAGLKLVTQFDGIDPPKDEDEDDLLTNGDEMRFTSQDGISAKEQQVGAGSAASAASQIPVQEPLAMEKLYISDDDIEDD